MKFKTIVSMIVATIVTIGTMVLVILGLRKVNGAGEVQPTPATQKKLDKIDAETDKKVEAIKAQTNAEAYTNTAPEVKAGVETIIETAVTDAIKDAEKFKGKGVKLDD